jgi:hypothetical protein
MDLQTNKRHLGLDLEVLAHRILLRNPHASTSLGTKQKKPAEHHAKRGSYGKARSARKINFIEILITQTKESLYLVERQLPPCLERASSSNTEPVMHSLPYILLAPLPQIFGRFKRNVKLSETMC